MFSLPTSLLSHIISKFVRFIDFAQLSSTCKAANLFYKKYMFNSRYASGCDRVKLNIYKKIQNLLISKKNAVLNLAYSKLNPFCGKAKKLRDQMNANNAAKNKTSRFNEFRLKHIVDYILIGFNFNFAPSVQLLKEERITINKYKRVSNIIKYLGIYNVTSFKPKSKLDKLLFSAGQMKAGHEIKYMSRDLYLHAVLKENATVIKKYYFYRSPIALMHAKLLPEHSEIKKFLFNEKNSPMVPTNPKKLNKPFVIKRIAEKNQFHILDEIITTQNILMAVSVKVLVKYMLYLISDEPPKIFNNIFYRCATIAVIKNNQKILKVCEQIDKKKSSND